MASVDSYINAHKKRVLRFHGLLQHNERLSRQSSVACAANDEPAAAAAPTDERSDGDDARSIRFDDVVKGTPRLMIRSGIDVLYPPFPDRHQQKDADSGADLSSDSGYSTNDSKPAKSKSDTPCRDPNMLCVVCNEPSTRACVKCNLVQYCSSNHAELDLELHGMLCKQVPDTSDSGDDERTVIVFPTRTEQPILCQQTIADAWERPTWYWDIRGTVLDPARDLEATDRFRAFSPKHIIRVMPMIEDGHNSLEYSQRPANSCIWNCISSTFSVPWLAHRGQAMAVCYERVGNTFKWFDFTPRDLRHVIVFFKRQQQREYFAMQRLYSETNCWAVRNPSLVGDEQGRKFDEVEIGPRRSARQGTPAKRVLEDGIGLLRDKACYAPRKIRLLTSLKARDKKYELSATDVVKSRDAALVSVR